MILKDRSMHSELAVRLILIHVKARFSKAKYVPADEPDIEDDCIELNDKHHVQLCSDGSYGVVTELDDKTFNTEYVTEFGVLLEKINGLD